MAKAKVDKKKDIIQKLREKDFKWAWHTADDCPDPDFQKTVQKELQDLDNETIKKLMEIGEKMVKGYGDDCGCPKDETKEAGEDRNPGWWNDAGRTIPITQDRSHYIVREYEIINFLKNPISWLPDILKEMGMNYRTDYKWLRDQINRENFVDMMVYDMKLKNPWAERLITLIEELKPDDIHTRESLAFIEMVLARISKPGKAFEILGLRYVKSHDGQSIYSMVKQWGDEGNWVASNKQMFWGQPKSNSTLYWSDGYSEPNKVRIKTSADKEAMEIKFKNEDWLNSISIRQALIPLTSSATLEKMQSIQELINKKDWSKEKDKELKVNLLQGATGTLVEALRREYSKKVPANYLNISDHHIKFRVDINNDNKKTVQDIFNNFINMIAEETIIAVSSVQFSITSFYKQPAPIVHFYIKDIEVCLGDGDFLDFNIVLRPTFKIKPIKEKATLKKERLKFAIERAIKLKRKFGDKAQEPFKIDKKFISVPGSLDDVISPKTETRKDLILVD